MTQEPISNSEIIAETFQAIRVQQMHTVEQVKEVMLERFPEISDARRQECLVDLAGILCKANADIFAPSQRQKMRSFR